MLFDDFPENPYLLLTPGPLSTTKSVKAAMLRDWCTWDGDYTQRVQHIRRVLVELATKQDGYTAILMQGSGTFAVEATIGSALPREGKLLVLANGAYGRRMAEIAERIGLSCLVHDSGETEPPDQQCQQMHSGCPGFRVRHRQEVGTGANPRSCPKSQPGSV